MTADYWLMGYRDQYDGAFNPPRDRVQEIAYHDGWNSAESDRRSKGE